MQIFVNSVERLSSLVHSGPPCIMLYSTVLLFVYFMLVITQCDYLNHFCSCRFIVYVIITI